MRTQKAISAKINYLLLERLERESFVSCKKKNRIINEAIRMYVDMKDLERYFSCVPSKGSRDIMLKAFFQRYDLEQLRKYILYER